MNRSARAQQPARQVSISLREQPLFAYLILNFNGVEMVGFALALIVAVYVAQGVINARERVTSIEITAEQFPEVHQRIEHSASAFELDVEPRAHIAHEVGHVAAGHTTYWYTGLSSFRGFIPFVRSALSRAKEHSADNDAYAVVPGGINGIVLLSGGKYLYPLVDGHKIAERSTTDRGFFIWFANALASHPVQTKRLAALYDRSRPGKLF